MSRAFWENVRDEKVISLEEAIYKNLPNLPATKIENQKKAWGIKDRDTCGCRII